MWSLAKGMLDENARSRTTLYTKRDTRKVRPRSVCVLQKGLFSHLAACAPHCTRSATPTRRGGMLGCCAWLPALCEFVLLFC